MNYFPRTPQMLLIASAIMLLSSCATILTEKKQKGVYITSNVPEATVYDSKNKVIGTTPLLYKPDPKKTEHILSIEKEGYKPSSLTIKYEENEVFAVMDALLFCIPCIVDYPTGNIYKIDKDSANIVLKKIIDKKAETVNIFVEEVQWKMKEGALIGDEYKELLYFKKSYLESYLYKDAVVKASKESYYNILNVTKGDFQYVKKTSTIELVPTISNLKSTYKKVKGVPTRFCEMDLTWGITQNNGSKVLKEVNLHLSKEVQYAETKPTIAAMIEASIVDLFNDDELYQLLLKESKSLDISPLSDKNVIKLPRVYMQQYTKNKDLIKSLMKSVVTIQHDEGHGSGFLISEDGYIITNYHVIKDKKTVNIQFNESMTLSADVIRGNDQYDVALLKLTGKGFVPMEVFNSDSISPGEDVFAIGTPEDISLGQSVTKGVVSGKRKIADRVYIQTDVAINSGNSGGPLLNEDGKVIAMVTAKLIGQGIEGIGFCVPTNTIFEILNIEYK
jgi:serine protease Do